MSSKRKIRASQRNGAKSHGPVTPAGRLKSSANSARHHLLSKSILLENERPDAFADLLAGLTREFNPQTETQRALVETMAVSRWRQMRIWAVERATLQSAMDAVDSDTNPSATRAALAFRSLADESRTLDLLHRYETRFDRQFGRSLNLLMKLAQPDNPLTQFCQTNLIPQSDTSGAGLPACAGAEGASDEAFEDASDADPEASPAPEESQPESDASHPGALAHFPTFVIDRTPPVAAPSPYRHAAAAAAHLTSILDLT